MSDLKIETLKKIILMSFNKCEVYTGEEVFEILRNNGVL